MKPNGFAFSVGHGALEVALTQDSAQHFGVSPAKSQRQAPVSDNSQVDIQSA